MNKTVWKLRPGDYWRIGEYECWFADMAGLGLHLQKVGTLLATFQKGDPQDTRYRIDVADGSIGAGQKDLYREYGWEFVTAYGKFNVFSSPARLNAPELHTDPAEQGFTLKTLDRQLQKNAAFMAILLILFLGMMSGIFFLDSTPFLNMVQGQFLQQCFTVVVELYVFYSLFQASGSIRNLRKALAEGRPIDHQADWRKNRWQRNSVNGVFLLAACLTIVLPVTTILRSENATLPEQEISLPIVRLSEVENDPDYIRKPGYLHDGVDWSNRYSYDWSPLAPIRYETDEHGLVAGKSWRDGSGVYSPSIHTQYYHLAFAGMADGLVRDLLKRNWYREDQEVRQISFPPFDTLYVSNGDSGKQVFAALGNDVVYIRYYGYAGLDRILALAAEKLAGPAERPH